jgi:hypothetical protein
MPLGPKGNKIFTNHTPMHAAWGKASAKRQTTSFWFPTYVDIQLNYITDMPKRLSDFFSPRPVISQAVAVAPEPSTSSAQEVPQRPAPRDSLDIASVIDGQN